MKISRQLHTSLYVGFMICLMTAYAPGQTYNVLHAFGTSKVGRDPRGSLVQGQDGIFYGTTFLGGTSDKGQVFRVNPDGTGYTALKDFTGSDGALPGAGLVMSATTLYGTTGVGGSNNCGTVFKVNTDGSGFAVLKEFGNSADGVRPWGRLVLSGTTLYGTASEGGADYGTVFKVNTDGSRFVVLKRFGGADGAYPFGALTVSGQTLYGTTSGGGSNQAGTVFMINVDGSGFTLLKELSWEEGADPRAGVLLSGTNLYGTTQYGGPYSSGTVFRLNSDGSGFAVLKGFDFGEGYFLAGELVLGGDTLYGTSPQGGSVGGGILFKINTDGGDFAVLKEFTDLDGTGGPYGGLALTGSALYGTTTGINEFPGTIFRIETNGSAFNVLTNFADLDGVGALDLTWSGETFFGVTASGGAGGGGTLFKLGLDGSGYTVLKQFTNQSEGVQPNCRLLIDGDTIYGSASYGGATWNGILFKMNTNGSGFAVLKDFTNPLDGSRPSGDLVLMGSILYGTTGLGGRSNCGTIFKIDTDGSGYSVLRHFEGPDGRQPMAGLVLSEGTLYGTTIYGGSNDLGEVFSMDTNGGAFAILKHFGGDDGGGPEALLLSGDTLYGATPGGGNGYGTIYKLKTDGSGFASYRVFDWETACSPQGRLCQVGETLFGVAGNGGPGGGAVFQMDTSGSNFFVLKNFSEHDGNYPQCMSAGFAIVGAKLFGTTTGGGIAGGGVLYSLSLLPEAPSVPDRTAEVGGSISLLMTNVGSPPFGYQWFYNGTTVLPGGTTNQLLLSNLQTGQSGEYTLVITNAFGAFTSAPVVVRIVPRVERRPVPAIRLTGETGSTLQVEYVDALTAPVNWSPLEAVSLSSNSQFCFDAAETLSPARFYRAWQTGTPASPPVLSLPFLVPALTLTGSPGEKIRVDGINPVGPTDAWFTLNTVTLTNTSQLYFDVSAPGQPARLYRLVPVP